MHSEYSPDILHRCIRYRRIRVPYRTRRQRPLSLLRIQLLVCTFQIWKRKNRPDLHFRLTQPLNKVLGRRGTIFFACIFSSLSCLAQAFSKNWKMMVGFRILLGLGIGPKSATIPIYASECAPANIRGALVMFWQFFTAFGIMMGYFSGAAFRGVLDGTKNDLCPQPKISTPTPSPTPSPAPSTTPSPTPSSTPSLTSAELQKTLLALRCVGGSLMIALCVFRTLSTSQDVKALLPRSNSNIPHANMI